MLIDTAMTRFSPAQPGADAPTSAAGSGCDDPAARRYRLLSRRVVAMTDSKHLEIFGKVPLNHG